MILQGPPALLSRMLSFIYAFSLLGLAANQIIPAAAETMGQLLPSLLGLGIASASILPLVAMRRGLSRVAGAAALCSPFVYFALGTGMKENVILALMPVVYMSWLASRSVIVKAALITATGFVVALLTVYVSEYRQDVWHGGQELTVGQAVAQFADTADSGGMLATSHEGAVAFLARNNASVYRGWTVSVADEYGYEPALVFAPMAYVLIPRALWPAKPAIRQGWEYSGLVFGEAYIASSDTSTSAGLYPAFYLGFGWPAVIAGAISLGLIMAGLLKLAWRVGGGPLVGLFVMSMVPHALRLDETWTVGALSGPIIGFIYLAAVFSLSMLMARVLAGPGVLRTASPDDKRRLPRTATV
jgi:hypothetical protein